MKFDFDDEPDNWTGGDTLNINQDFKQKFEYTKRRQLLD